MTERFVVANWKLHHTVAQAQAFAATFVARAREANGQDAQNAQPSVRCIIAPPSTSLYPLAQTLRGSSIAVCAQNISHHDQGAFTGEVSAPLVHEAGARYVLVGHSERRAQFAETSELTALKLAAAARTSLCPILCVGESAQERADGRTFEVVREQLLGGCESYLTQNLGPLMVAYEPVWAIGTGKAPDPAEAQAVHQSLRQALLALPGQRGAQVPLLYGGSVTPQNTGPLIEQQHIDGVLVGGASLDAHSLIAIETAARVAKA